MTRKILGGVLAFAVRKVGWLLNNPRAMLAGAFAMSANVLHAHHHRVSDLTGAGRVAIISHIAENDSPIANPELRSMTVTDSHALLKSESGA
jgi:hypothetical protein